MTMIDHRILIPVPQHVVWDYLGDLTHNAKWQTDCKSIAFLTTKQQGVGARYRYSSAQGKEYVAEIRAWYEGLGYEYAYVERPPFKNAFGRIRLQEIAEGTIVQWTFHFEGGGLFGSAARYMDNAVQQSLKKLYLQLKTDRARHIEPHIETKALMRDAPDVEERANYQPRHPTQVEKKPIDIRKPLKRVEPEGIEEPEVAVDDTRPTRTVTTVQVETPTPAPLTEPSFLADIPPETLPPAKRETDEHRRVEVDVLSHAQPIDIDAIAHELAGKTAPAPSIEDAHSSENLAASAPTERKRPAPARDAQPTESATAPVIAEPPRTDSERITDTSKVSIWEVFGLPRPSESQVITPVREPGKTPPKATPKRSQPSKPRSTVPKAPPAPPAKAVRKAQAQPVAAAPDPTPDAPLLHLADLEQPSLRLGMRRALRRQQIRLRRFSM